VARIFGARTGLPTSFQAHGTIHCEASAMSWVGIFRDLHVLLAVFWAGSMFFFVLFLEPSVRSLGPDGGKFMQALVARRFLPILITVGALTLVSGLIVFWRLTNGFTGDWLLSGYAHSILGGATLGLVTLGIGFFVSRPTLQQLMQKGAAIAGGPPSEADQAEMARLQGRLRKAARTAAVLLLLSVLLMASARYL
jgi:uncharacterized membrane protein